jgi:hypothetical protein
MTVTETTAQRNDRIRKNGLFSVDDRHDLVVTRGVDALGQEAVMQLVRDMMAFDNFTEDMDPHGDHDFGELRSGDTRVWFKIDQVESDKLVITLLLPEEW